MWEDEVFFIYTHKGFEGPTHLVTVPLRRADKHLLLQAWVSCPRGCFLANEVSPPHLFSALKEGRPQTLRDHGRLRKPMETQLLSSQWHFLWLGEGFMSSDFRSCLCVALQARYAVVGQERSSAKVAPTACVAKEMPSGVTHDSSASSLLYHFWVISEDPSLSSTTPGLIAFSYTNGTQEARRTCLWADVRAGTPPHRGG